MTTGSISYYAGPNAVQAMLDQTTWTLGAPYFLHFLTTEERAAQKANWDSVRYWQPDTPIDPEYERLAGDACLDMCRDAPIRLRYVAAVEAYLQPHLAAMQEHYRAKAAWEASQGEYIPLVSPLAALDYWASARSDEPVKPPDFCGT